MSSWYNKNKRSGKTKTTTEELKERLNDEQTYCQRLHGYMRILVVDSPHNGAKAFFRSIKCMKLTINAYSL